MNEKIFDQWNEKKKETHRGGISPYFFSGEIWWAQLGKNIATEVAGKGEHFLRPVVVLQRVYGNSCLAIPLSSKLNRGPYYFCFHDTQPRMQCALLTQIRYLDGKRLKYKHSSIKKEDFENLQKAIVSLIKK